MLIAFTTVRADGARPMRPGAFAGLGRGLRVRAAGLACVWRGQAGLRSQELSGVRARRQYHPFAKGGPPPSARVRSAGSMGGSLP